MIKAVKFFSKARWRYTFTKSFVIGPSGYVDVYKRQMFFTVGFSLKGFISIVIAVGFITLVRFAPDMVQNILNAKSGIA